MLQRTWCSGFGNPRDSVGDYERVEDRGGEGAEEAIDVAESGPHDKARKVVFGRITEYS